MHNDKFSYHVLPAIVFWVDPWPNVHLFAYIDDRMISVEYRENLLKIHYIPMDSISAKILVRNTIGSVIS